ncbi:Uncharacterised protein [Chlamydia abortus]|nr:Uncharacterised protein [Chlamydia abortus]
MPASLSNCTKVKLALVPYLRTDSAISLICKYSTGAWTRPPSAPSKTGNACCIFLCSSLGMNESAHCLSAHCLSAHC